jgi:hypothetical protein
MFNKIQHQIPNVDPDLKIGSLYLWITGYTADNQIGQGDMAYLKAPTLLDSENMVIFSPISETPLFSIRKLLNDLVNVYNNIEIQQAFEFEPVDSEFSLSLKNNFGQILLVIRYNSWSHNTNLEFEERIDQSYLPAIIRDLEKILGRFA